MRWSNLVRSALFSVAICCVAMPEAEAIEIFAPPGLSAHVADGMITQVRGGRGGGGVRRGGGGMRGGGMRGRRRRVSRRRRRARRRRRISRRLRSLWLSWWLRLSRLWLPSLRIWRSARQRSARRRLPHTIVGSIATATESVTTTTTDLYGSDVVAYSKGNVRPVWAVRSFTPGSASRA